MFSDVIHVGKPNCHLSVLAMPFGNSQSNANLNILQTRVQKCYDSIYILIIIIIVIIIIIIIIVVMLGFVMYEYMMQNRKTLEAGIQIPI